MNGVEQVINRAKILRFEPDSLLACKSPCKPGYTAFTVSSPVTDISSVEKVGQNAYWNAEV